MDSSTWQPDFTSTFDAQLGQNNEDWEDWLRWDPAADSTSPENDFSVAGSSKNDSPVQTSVFPAGDFDKLGIDGTNAPPLIMGEDGLDFGNTFPGNDAFNFGNPQDTTNNFDFGMGTATQTGPPQPQKIDTNSSLWPLPSNAPLQDDLDLSALSAMSNDQLYQMSSCGPGSVNTPSLHHSPESTTNKRTSLSSQTSPDPPKKRGGRKRKAEVDQETKNENGDSQDGDEPPVKKTSHNVIEKRYRNNLNDKIVELRQSVPALRAMGRDGEEGEDLEGLAPAHKLNKATIMAKATEYIKHLEKRNSSMEKEMAELKARVASVEAAFGKARSRQSQASTDPPNGTVRPREMSTASQNGLQTYLNVPNTMQQQQYMQQQAQPSYNRPPNPPAEAQNRPSQNARGGLMNKVMLGSMAGLMMMEGYSESQSGSDSSHGLAAVPGMHHLFRRGAESSFTSPTVLSGQSALPLLKVFLIFGAVAYLLLPLLSFSPGKKQKARPVVRLPQAPSLASPVEVRRKAWLTAVQSVWIPKHFLLEVVAVAAKMLKLSVRRLIGSQTFTAVTGANKEEEAARIKAWDIAIDAQLAGGDAEVSYYRLLLTLMASGTLPDSPNRLAQKAVHFRVFFWEVANAGYGNLVMFKQFTEKVGKIYWDSARKQQKELLHAKAQGRPGPDDEVDILPDHLARLVELDCDEVLSDEMIQRAWNLAWNKPSAHGLTPNVARDSVIEDHAIRSPLDAVAAWYANILVDETLADALSSGRSRFDIEYYLGLAISIAPPASATQARALAAKAVLSNSNREGNILTALDALPVMSPNSPMNLVNHAPASPEVRAALTLAKVISLSSSASSVAARSKAAKALASLHLAPEHFTLLTAVGTYRLLRALSADRQVATSMQGLEEVACSLRVWVGTSAGRNAGLSKDERAKIVDCCLCVAKRAGGWEEGDSGYGSRSVSPDRV
ncbi:hypothetical protein Q7P37_004264 [Cladosporium fusiforme]